MVHFGSLERTEETLHCPLLTVLCTAVGTCPPQPSFLVDVLHFPLLTPDIISQVGAAVAHMSLSYAHLPLFRSGTL